MVFIFFLPVCHFCVSHLSPQAPPLFAHLCLFILHVSVSAWDRLSGPLPAWAGEGPRYDIEGYTPPWYTLYLQGPQGEGTQCVPWVSCSPASAHTFPLSP